MSGRMVAHVDGPVGWLIFDNPARHNAMSMTMNEQIPPIVDQFQRDDAIRVVVMRGAGDRAFVSGADISEFESLRSGGDPQRAYDRAQGLAQVALGGLDKPLIAMIRGFCIGGGLATALRADIRIAADDALFAIPAARLGLGYPFAGIHGLVQLVGPANAGEIMLSARRFTADEALRMGLVNRVVAQGDLEDAVRELAATVSENAPLTMRAAKAAIQESLKDPSRRDLDKVAKLVEQCFTSEDYVEGRRAFMEKRTPNFKGR